MSDIAVDVENPMVLEGHLQCAAIERPIDLSRDRVYFGAEIDSICQEHLIRGDDGASSYPCTVLM